MLVLMLTTVWAAGILRVKTAEKGTDIPVKTSKKDTVDLGRVEVGKDETGPTRSPEKPVPGAGRPRGRWLRRSASSLSSPSVPARRRRRPGPPHSPRPGASIATAHRVLGSKQREAEAIGRVTPVNVLRRQSPISSFGPGCRHQTGPAEHSRGFDKKSLRSPRRGIPRGRWPG